MIPRTSSCILKYIHSSSAEVNAFPLWDPGGSRLLLTWNLIADYLHWYLEVFWRRQKFLGRQKVGELVGTQAGFVVRPAPLGINTLPRDISLREIGTFPIESTPSKYLCPLVLHLHPCHTLPWLKNLTAEIIAEQQLSSPGKMLNLYVPHPHHWIRELWNFLAWIGL